MASPAPASPTESSASHNPAGVENEQEHQNRPIEVHLIIQGAQGEIMRPLKITISPKAPGRLDHANESIPTASRKRSKLHEEGEEQDEAYQYRQTEHAHESLPTLKRRRISLNSFKRILSPSLIYGLSLRSFYEQRGSLFNNHPDHSPPVASPNIAQRPPMPENIQDASSGSAESERGRGISWRLLHISTDSAYEIILIVVNVITIGVFLVMVIASSLHTTLVQPSTQFSQSLIASTRADILNWSREAIMIQVGLSSMRRIAALGEAYIEEPMWQHQAGLRPVYGHLHTIWNSPYELLAREPRNWSLDSNTSSLPPYKPWETTSHGIYVPEFTFIKEMYHVLLHMLLDLKEIANHGPSTFRFTKGTSTQFRWSTSGSVFLPPHASLPTMEPKLEWCDDLQKKECIELWSKIDGMPPGADRYPPPSPTARPFHPGLGSNLDPPTTVLYHRINEAVRLLGLLSGWTVQPGGDSWCTIYPFHEIDVFGHLLALQDDISSMNHSATVTLANGETYSPPQSEQQIRDYPTVSDLVKALHPSIYQPLDDTTSNHPISNFPSHVEVIQYTRHLETLLGYLDDLNDRVQQVVKGLDPTTVRRQNDELFYSAWVADSVERVHDSARFLDEIARVRVRDMYRRAQRSLEVLNSTRERQSNLQAALRKAERTGIGSLPLEMLPGIVRELAMDWSFVERWVAREIEDVKDTLRGRDKPFREAMDDIPNNESKWDTAIKHSTVWSRWNMDDARQDPFIKERFCWGYPHEDIHNQLKDRMKKQPWWKFWKKTPQKASEVFKKKCANSHGRNGYKQGS